VRARIAVDDWTNGTQRILTKWQLPDNSFLFAITGTGLLAAQWWESGTTSRNANSTAALTVNDYDTLWVRMTLDVDNGASGYDLKFYTSDDGSTWTQLGATVTGGAVTNVTVSTSPVRVGVRGGGSDSMTAKVYRAQIMDAIDGSPVLDIDTSVVSSGSATSFTDLTGNHTVTISRSTSGRKSVAVVSPVWLFGTDDSMQVADNALLDFNASDSFTVVAVVRQWDNQASGATVYSKRASNVRHLINVDSSADDRFQISDSVNDGTVVVPEVRGIINVIAGRVDRTAETIQVTNQAGSSTTVSTSSVGTLVNDGVLGIGRRLDNNSNAGDFEMVAFAIHRRVLSDAEIAALQTFYENRAA
jgi:hypothetical protein